MEKFLIRITDAEELISFIQKSNEIDKSGEFETIANYLYEANYPLESIEGILYAKQISVNRLQ